MKKIGFIDYYINEWHADNYPAWIKEVSDEFEVKYVWAEQYESPVGPLNTDQWCEQFGAERCETIAELCEKSDYIIILSPSNPEKHLGYAREALKYGKNTYIDKTFAPSLDEAKEIFAIAEQYGTKFFSTSALRYATELEQIAGTKNLITTSGGGNMPEYIIHQIEMAVKSIKGEPVRVKAEKQGNQCIATVEFDNGNRWTAIYSPNLVFTVCGDNAYTAVTSNMFVAMIADVLRFFKSGEVSFDTAETLRAIKIRDGILKACETANGEWINL